MRLVTYVYNYFSNNYLIPYKEYIFMSREQSKNKVSLQPYNLTTFCL